MKNEEKGTVQGSLAVQGLKDTRSTSLVSLAREAGQEPGNVLPPVETETVVVAAFASSI
jgi:hypothetical protein